MDIIIIIKAIILGIVEGLTEFLPISSTGHLIVFDSLLDFQSNQKVFEISIQLGAILAIIFEYRRYLFDTLMSIGKKPESTRLTLNLIIAFIPAAVVGVLFIKQIKYYLFNPISVATALFIGGLIILWAEKRQKNHRTTAIASINDIHPKDALIIGLAQITALIPGTSRSGSTIIGGMLWGLNRKTATEFSFFLAIPVMIAATSFDIIQNYHAFKQNDIILIIIGLISAFFAGLFSVRALLKYVSHKDYIPFAWYRMIFGGFILITSLLGLISWQ